MTSEEGGKRVMIEAIMLVYPIGVIEVRAYPSTVGLTCIGGA